ncbi:RNA-directed DNA polymerase, eukaryota, reverse transcriptase zinc-binding domain protein [Tanacetum coccineum]|uniref:RNA-directed DNA polymerase, eukaryota, reverse transcriptase zinc-binding domain protein n=1 Tax=Tanacetum coccineum TaxID=301880 RepID=A0ABQ4ZLY2_9ASTR
MQKKLGNGADTYFWEDLWHGDMVLKQRYPRLYALEVKKTVDVASKLSQENLTWSFRRVPRSRVEQDQLTDLTTYVEGVVLGVTPDRWYWTLDGSGEFSVASARKVIDDNRFPEVSTQTRWIKAVPIKVNIHAWKVRMDCLPTRLNISRRGIDIPSILCPVCGSVTESSSHLFFDCLVAKDNFRKICRWWEVDFMEVHTFDEWVSWIVNLRIPIKHKRLRSICEESEEQVSLLRRMRFKIATKIMLHKFNVEGPTIRAIDDASHDKATVFKVKALEVVDKTIRQLARLLGSGSEEEADEGKDGEVEEEGEDEADEGKDGEGEEEADEGEGSGSEEEYDKGNDGYMTQMQGGDVGLCEESKEQVSLLRRMRFKISTKILLHKVNVHAENMFDLAYKQMVVGCEIIYDLPSSRMEEVAGRGGRRKKVAGRGGRRKKVTGKGGRHEEGVWSVEPDLFRSGGRRWKNVEEESPEKVC